MPTIEPERSVSQLPMSDLISSGRSPSRSARMPSATTGPGPAIPIALVERIAAASPGPDLVDVGCGTGTAARQFQAAGCTVLGVEPDARMADFARRSGVEVEASTFEAWEPAGRQFDAVVAGTAWHWVDPVAGAVKAARVLRAGGRLAPFHHVFQPPAGDSAATTAEVYRRVVPDSPFGFGSQRPEDGYGGVPAAVRQDRRRDPWRRARSPSRNSGTFEWERAYTREEWLDQLPTRGRLTRLPPDKLVPIPGRTSVPPSTRSGAASRCPTRRWRSPRRAPIGPAR